MSTINQTKPVRYVIRRAGILRRGWTDSMIRRFLTRPDCSMPNPYFRRRSLPLYFLWRVEQVERTTAFREAMAKLRARRKAAEDSRFLGDLAKLRPGIYRSIESGEPLAPELVGVAERVLARWSQYPECAGTAAGLSERVEIERQVAVARARAAERDVQARACGHAWAHEQMITLAIPRSAFEAAHGWVTGKFQASCRKHHSNFKELRAGVRELHPEVGSWAYRRLDQCFDALIERAAGRFRADKDLEHAVIRGRIGDFAGWLPPLVEGE